MRWKSLFLWGVLLSAAGVGYTQSSEGLVLVAGRPGGMCVYELRFAALDTVPPDAAFELVLPRPFDVSRVQLASSKALKGGFAVHVVGDTVRIFRSGLGPAVGPGTLIDLQVAAVQCPRQLPVSAQATVRILPHRTDVRRVFFVPVTTDTSRIAR